MTAIYDQIGQGYDYARRADPYIVSRLLHHLGPGLGHHLDIGCGSGNYTIALRAAGLKMVGVDASEVMLGHAREKAPSLCVARADAARLPFPSGSFASGVSTVAHHHFPDVGAAFRDVFRTLSPGARFVIFSFTAEQMRHYWLCEYFPETMARACAAYDDLDTGRHLERAGFRRVATELYDVRSDLQDKFLYSGKFQPQLYLDPRVRAGISTFPLFGDDAEIARGCARLLDDIRTGRFADVASTYQNNGGDYTFWIAEK